MPVLAIVTDAIVTPHTDYCKVVCVGLPLKNVRNPQVAQNAEVRLLTGAGHRQHMLKHPMLKQLHWLTLNK